MCGQLQILTGALATNDFVHPEADRASRITEDKGTKGAAATKPLPIKHQRVRPDRAQSSWTCSAHSCQERLTRYGNGTPCRIYRIEHTWALPDHT